MDKEDTARGERIFERFLTDLRDVACLSPREKYLYPLLKGVPFQDFHVALQMVVEANKEAVNDNRKHYESGRESCLLKQSCEIRAGKPKKNK